MSKAQYEGDETPVCTCYLTPPGDEDHETELRNDSCPVHGVMEEQTQEGQSAVANILAQISNEYTSAKLGLQGLAQGTPRHAFITARMENMGKLHEALQEFVGNAAAMPLIAQRLDELGGTNP